MIKVLQLIDGSFLGGGQANILSIIRNIDRMKFETAVAAGGGGSFEKEVEKYSVPFYPVEIPKTLRHKYLKNLLDLLSSQNYDIVHSHGGVSGFYGRIMKKHCPWIKSIHTIHGIHYLNSRGFLLRNISRSVEQYLVQFTDRTICETRPDFITAVDNRIADFNKTVVIHNGIKLTDFSPSEGKPELMKELGFDENNFIVGNISRFDVQKNQKLIIQAAYFLVRAFPQIRFVFVGDGRYFKRMKNYVRESNLENYVVFTGERADLREFYRLFDIFVLPSFWEGMPYVLLEAMASGLPIICSNIPNHAEVVNDNYSALTIDPHNMDDLFRMISLMYRDEDLRRMLADNAYNESKKYDEKVMTARIEEIYGEVTSG